MGIFRRARYIALEQSATNRHGLYVDTEAPCPLRPEVEIRTSVVDLHSNLRLGPIWVKSGTEIESGAAFSLNLSANFALQGYQAKATFFSIAGFQVSMTASDTHSAPVSTASMASSLRTPKTRAVIPSAIRTR